LATQPPNVKTYIQEAICTMLDAFQPLKEWATEDDIARIVAMVELNMGKVVSFLLAANGTQSSI